MTDPVETVARQIVVNLDGLEPRGRKEVMAEAARIIKALEEDGFVLTHIPTTTVFEETSPLMMEIRKAQAQESEEGKE